MSDKPKKIFQVFVNSKLSSAKCLFRNEIYYLIVTLFLTTLTFQSGNAQIIIKTLKRDSAVGVGLKVVKFKAGTKITIKDKKVVLEGVLAQDSDLSFATKKPVRLKGGTKVTFDEKGNVLSGTMAKTSYSVCFTIPYPYSRCIEALEESAFSLYENGMLKTCVLKNVEEFVSGTNGKVILFANKGKVTIRPNGTIQSGILYNDFPAGSVGYLKSYCFIEFGEKGNILKGVRSYKLLNRRYILEHIDITNGKIYKSKNEHPCLCKII